MRRTICFFLIILLTSCDRGASSSHYQGYAEGEYVRVSSPVGGQLLTLSVSRGDAVKEGDALFMLEQEKEQQALVEADTALTLSTLQLQRQTNLVNKKVSTKEDLDRAQARNDQDKAQLAQIKWQLDQKTVKSPVAGAVIDTLYQMGEYVPASYPVVKLLPPENIKVRFFVPERDVGALKLGQTATLTCDGCAEALPAQITFIAPEAEFTPPVIYSQENKQKLVFMVEARTSKEKSPLLHPGQPVQVDVGHE